MENDDESTSVREIQKLYEKFLKRLEGSFLDFVQSDEVNMYLQTIGGAVKREILQDGILHEFVMVTGYEEERGRWGTVYNGKIRFGAKSIPVQGFVRKPMILTPNFFYGRNKDGEEVEYRMGLSKAKSLRVHPIILRKVGTEVEIRMLPDLCVVHKGISIDAKSARRLSEVEVNNITVNQQFLSCFWNIDDYLRKQNPHFTSDFDMDAWKAVQVFSGRIVDQMLWKIANGYRHHDDEALYLPNRCNREITNPEKWIIPQAEEIYSRDLVSRIEWCLENEDDITVNQLSFLIKNLCSYMARFNNFGPLDHLLLRNSSKILSFIINAIENSDSEISGAAQTTFVKALLVLQKMIVKNPEVINEVEWESVFSVNRFFQTTEANSMVEFTNSLIKIAPLVIEKKSVSIVLEILPLLDAFRTFRFIIGNEPQYIDQASIDKFFEIVSTISAKKFDQGILEINNKDYCRLDTLGALALDICMIITRNMPWFLSQKWVCALVERMIFLKQGFLQLFSKILETSPQYINQGLITMIREKLNHCNPMIRELGVKAYMFSLARMPELFSKSLCDFLYSIGTMKNYDIGLCLLKLNANVKRALKSAFNKNSSFVSHEAVTEIIDLMASEEVYRRSRVILRESVFEALRLIVKHSPKFVSQRAVEVIYKLIPTDPLPALEIYREIVENVPQLISQREIDQIQKCWLEGRDKVKRLALEILLSVERKDLWSNGSPLTLTIKNLQHVKDSSVIILFRILFEIKKGYIPRAIFVSRAQSDKVMNARVLTLIPIDHKNKPDDSYFEQYLKEDLFGRYISAGEVIFLYISRTGVHLPFQIYSTEPRGRVGVASWTTIQFHKSSGR